MEAYCVKCREKREMTNEEIKTDPETGKRSAKGKCPVCTTNMTRFLPKEG